MNIQATMTFILILPLVVVYIDYVKGLWSKYA